MVAGLIYKDKKKHEKVEGSFIVNKLLGLGHVDAICFAGGIGENGITSRAAILKDLENFGIILDEEKNKVRKEALISADDSKIKVFIVPTNEELMIARDTLELSK